MPVAAGLWTNEYIAAEHFAEDLKAARAFGIEEICLEVLLEGDSATGLPKIDRTSLTQVSKIMPQIRAAGLKYSIVMQSWPRQPLFAGPTDTARWQQAYLAEIKEKLLPRLAGFPPVRLCLGTDFGPLENQPAFWQTVFSEIRAAAPQQVKLLYSANMKTANKIAFWDACDEIGLFYPATIADAPRKFSREWHPKAAELARTFGKPIYLTHAYLISANKLLEFQNRLRFWPEDVAVNGINLNNIVTRTPLTDTLDYYGVADRPEFLEYLKTYTGENTDIGSK